ncbi:class I SAM-dependent methyltransferase [Cohnella thermotolerans]|uniref:class I SAM-dependent methyltransferase n=1 Tax=Cohnella thermotolerans TaxID=329858 RepID=UPI0003F65F17|nr:methyltransferase domain-containing protein [Cohnella thermotolerans]
MICSHVLEHVPDDRKAMRELYRVMKRGGWGIMQVPIALSLQTTKEDPRVIAPSHRLRVFGQEDHVRLYAKEDYVQRLESVGFAVKQIELGQAYKKADIFKYGLSPKDVLYVAMKPGPSHSRKGDEGVARGLKNMSWVNHLWKKFRRK